MGALMAGAILGVSGGPITDRAFMTAWSTAETRT
jgi:hypothetical protein